MQLKFNVAEEYREDIAIAGRAIFYGFLVNCNKPGDPFTFSLKFHSVWKVQHGWTVAKLSGGFFQQHETFANLDVALQQAYDKEHNYVDNN